MRQQAQIFPKTHQKKLCGDPFKIQIEFLSKNDSADQIKRVLTLSIWFLAIKKSIATWISAFDIIMTSVSVVSSFFYISLGDNEKYEYFCFNFNSFEIRQFIKNSFVYF